MRGRLAAMMLLFCSSLAGPAGAGPVFGSAGIETDPPFALPQWEQALRRIAAEGIVYSTCERHAGCPAPEVNAWLDHLAELGTASRLEQLRAVNAFLNRWPYRADEGNFGRRDHWATPLEFLARSGDCEDYAIAKYVSLRRLGVPAADLRLVVVQDLVRDTPHAVLIARVGEGWHVLDNLSGQVLPQEEVVHYAPYYSVNEDARWSHLDRASRQRLAAAAPLTAEGRRE